MALNLIVVVIVILLIRIVHKANREGFVNAGLIVAIIFVAIYCLVFLIQVKALFSKWNNLVLLLFLVVDRYRHLCFSTLQIIETKSTFNNRTNLKKLLMSVFFFLSFLENSQ